MAVTPQERRAEVRVPAPSPLLLSGRLWVLLCILPSLVGDRMAPPHLFPLRSVPALSVLRPCLSVHSPAPLTFLGLAGMREGPAVWSAARDLVFAVPAQPAKVRVLVLASLLLTRH